MSYCEVITMPGGGRAIVRMSGPAPALCDVCKRHRHTKLCDATIGRGTCAKKLCDLCNMPNGELDFCPDHKDEMVQIGLWDKP